MKSCSNKIILELGVSYTRIAKRFELFVSGNVTKVQRIKAQYRKNYCVTLNHYNDCITRKNFLIILQEKVNPRKAFESYNNTLLGYEEVLGYFKTNLLQKASQLKQGMHTIIKDLKTHYHVCITRVNFLEMHNEKLIQ